MGLIATLVGALLISAAVSAESSACADEAGCSYNGKCSAAGECACRPQWKGSHCASLSLVPTPRAAGLHGAHEPAVPSDPAHPIGAQPQRGYWGSSVLRGDDGRWHMWSAEMVGGCGIWAWCSNSQIVHAISATPTGAYQRKEVVQKGQCTAKPSPTFQGQALTDYCWCLQVWAHEPTVARAPTGEYVMMFTSAPWGPNGQPPVNGMKITICSTKPIIFRNPIILGLFCLY